MLAERHCIQNNLSEAEVLSTEAIISCDALDFGCNGGHLEKTMEFLEDVSIPAIACNQERLSYIGEALQECPLDDTVMVDETG